MEAQPVTNKEISRIVYKYLGRPGALLSILEDVQAKYRYLPEPALRLVAERTGESLVDVFGVATFYKLFSLKPRGEHLVSACLGTACHVRSAPLVARELERRLGICAGETTSDGRFTLETVNCLGACALGPIVVVDGHYHSEVRVDQIPEILQRATESVPGSEVPGQGVNFPVTVRCPRCNHSLMDPEHLIDGLPSVRMTLSYSDVHGWVRLSSVYGSFNHESEHEIPLEQVVNFFCPHCHTELEGAARCPECGASMVPMSLGQGSLVQICSRNGCRNHQLDLNPDKDLM